MKLFIVFLLVSRISVAQELKVLLPRVGRIPDVSKKTKVLYDRYNRKMGDIWDKSESGQKLDRLSKEEKEALELIDDVKQELGFYGIGPIGCSWYCGGKVDTVLSSSALIDLLAPGSYTLVLANVIWIAESTFLLYVGYKILTTPKILNTDRTGFVVPDQKALQAYGVKLEALLTDQRLFIKPDLTRKDIAEELGVSQALVSAILKEGLKMSFYKLVNRYRIEEAIRLIEQGSLESITVEALSKDIGFNSKTTFNKAFKRITGVTPTRYWKEKVCR